MSMMKRYQQLYGVHAQRSYARGGMKTGRRRRSARGRHQGPAGGATAPASEAVGDRAAGFGGGASVAAAGMLM